MPTQPPKEDENLNALELLWGGSGLPHVKPSPTERTPQPAATGRPATPRKSSDGPASAAPDSPTPIPQHYRCLHCGYRLAGAPTLRCPECGTDNAPERLEVWFDGAEQNRFDLVIWLVLAGLFLRVLLLPDFLTLARLGIAATIAWAAYQARNDKFGTIGGYYGMAAMLAGGLMLVVFSWSRLAIAFHTLDIIAAGLLIQAMTHDSSGARVAIGGGRPLALAMILLAPLLAIFCQLAHNLWDANWALRYPTLESYPLFGFALPYLAAAAAWLGCWYVLANIRRKMFRPGP